MDQTMTAVQEAPGEARHKCKGPPKYLTIHLFDRPINLVLNDGKKECDIIMKRLVVKNGIGWKLHVNPHANNPLLGALQPVEPVEPEDALGRSTKRG